MKKTNKMKQDTTPKVEIKKTAFFKILLFTFLFIISVIVIGSVIVLIPKNKDGWKTYASQNETIRYFDFDLKITQVSDIKIKAKEKPVYASDPKRDTRAIQIDFIVENLQKETRELYFNYYLIDSSGNIYEDQSWGIASYLDTGVPSLLHFQPNVPQDASVVFEVPLDFNTKGLKLKMNTIYTGTVFTNAIVYLNDIVVVEK
jgi:hypothetical protein